MTQWEKFYLLVCVGGIAIGTCRGLWQIETLLHSILGSLIRLERELIGISRQEDMPYFGIKQAHGDLVQVGELMRETHRLMANFAGILEDHHKELLETMGKKAGK